MIGQTLGHYRILEQIGAGGMGVVYRAHDERLDRDVALKVLPAGTLADEAARKRFRKEALTLSKLNHPNIETVFDFDTEDGVDFLVMELIPGISLDQKLLPGALPEKQVLRLGQQLAEGLAAAHAEGVIHRDLKPGNLRLTPDSRLKILDFGLAKLFREVAETDVTASVTMTQGVTGTLPYMAPEQLRGEKVDARSDVWAAGAVLYELATGKRPFPGEQGPVLIDAILNKEPKRPSALNGKLSAHLESLILKALDKEPNRRYQTAQELHVDLERLGSGAPLTVSTRLQALRRQRWQAATLALLLFAAIALGTNIGGLRNRLFSRPAVPQIESLAVLPLENLSGDPEQAYLADGMHEALITELGKLSGLRRVTARSSVLRYQKTDKPLPQIAQELGVDGVITGSVLRSGDRVQITAHLIRAATEEQLWSERYERELRDVLSVENEIVAAITRQIRLQLTPQEQARLAGVRPVNPEAYDAYLKGRFHWQKLSREELDIAERYFQFALEKDPQYALAYVGMADVWLARGDAGFLPARQTAPKVKDAVRRALELDDTLAEPHVTLANFAGVGEADWALADKEFRSAIRLDPNSANAHFMYADFLVSVKRKNE